MKLRKTLQKFAELQELKLRKYDKSRGSRGWKTDEVEDLFARIADELAEAIEELWGDEDKVLRFLLYSLADKLRRKHTFGKIKNPQRLAEELADIANFCMMTADASGGLDA